jgi:GNAT superfamily N-acetyltransferase
VKSQHQYDVRKISDLNSVDLKGLIEESRAEGFRFVLRLRDEYVSRRNCFDGPGEGLYGIFSRDGTIHGIGGLNWDPYCSGRETGRIRRFYIKKTVRGQGLGTMLLNRMIRDGQQQFSAFVLYTDTKEAAAFYERCGFRKNNDHSKISHRYHGKGGTRP